MSSYPHILALGYSEASMLLKAKSHEIAAIISIHGQREFAVEANVTHRLDLEFDDIASPEALDLIASYRARMQRQWEAEHGLYQHAPSAEDAQAIIRFAESIRHIQGTLLCHCGGGISRAPGAALLCLAAWTPPGEEEQCVREVFRTRPSASPHPDLVRFGDGILNRNGRLLEALNRIQSPPTQ